MNLPPEPSRNEETSANPYASDGNSGPSFTDAEPTLEEINCATLAHLSGCAGLIGFGYIGFAGPLIIWWLKKESSAYVEFQAKEAFNFQITILLIAITCGIITVLSCGTAFALIFLPVLLQLIFGILSVLDVRKGRAYRYPFNLRLMQ